jgi:hypothetical protein
MTMQIELNAAVARAVLGDALAAMWSGGPLSEQDMRALDAAQVLQPLTRYPNENAVPYPLIGSGVPSMQYGLSTLYSAADLTALTASDVVDAIAQARRSAAA